MHSRSLSLVFAVAAAFAAQADNPTWIVPNITGDWSNSDNWQDGILPAVGDVAQIMSLGANNLTNSLTINIASAVEVKQLLVQDPMAGKLKLTGTGSLTLNAGTGASSSILVATNSACYNQPYSHGHAIPDLDVPVTIKNGEAYLCWASDRGWSLDPNREPSIHAITKDFNKADSYMNFAGCDGWLSFQQGGGDYRAQTRVMGYVELRGTNQFKRLGASDIRLESWWLSACEGCWGSTPILLYSLLAGEQEATVPNNLHFDLHVGAGKKASTGPYYGCYCFQTADGTTSLSATNRLTFTGTITGDKAAGDPNIYNCGFVNSNGKNCIEKNARFLSPESSRIVLAGDSPNATVNVSGMTVVGFVEIAHANALGTGNIMPLACGNDGYWSTGQAGGLNGVLLRPGITYAGSISSRPVLNSSDNCMGTTPYTVVGAASAGAAEAVFSGAVTETIQQDYRCTPLRFHAPKGGKARFTGVVTANSTGDNSATVLAEGDIVLANPANSFAKPLQVRAGRLVLAADGAAGSQPVSLGGIVRVLPGFETVVALDDGSGINSHPAGWNWWSLSETPAGGSTIWYSGTWLHFLDDKHPTSIDGVTISNNQKILINSPDKKSSNGFWIVKGDGYQRPWEQKLYSDYRGLYGTKFKVTGGNKYGGKTFFFAIDVASTKLSGWMDSTAGKQYTERSLAFHEEPTDADVAVMTEGAVTIANDIEVTRNYSAGKSTIGGVSAAVSGFSGDVTLAKSVTLSAAEGGQVNFTGAFSGDGDIIAEGAGTVDLTAATVSTASTNGIALAGGTLKLTSAQTSAKGLKWIRRVDGASDSTGVLTVDGNLDLTHATFEGFTFNDETDTEHALKIAEATGSILLPEKMRINKRWTLFVDNGSVYAKAAIPGLMIRIK